LHDSAPAHQALATQKKLAYLDFQCLDQPPISPDLAPSDYHLFPGLKKQLKGCHFSSDMEVIAAAETWLDGQPEFFLSGLQKLEQQTKNCNELRGEYIEQIPNLVTVACFLPARAKDLSATLVYYKLRFPSLTWKSFIDGNLNIILFTCHGLKIISLHNSNKCTYS